MKLQKLLNRCKCGVYIKINEHRDSYTTAEKCFNELFDFDPSYKEEIDPEVLKKMIENDTVIEIQFYPDTPIGSYTVYHYDMEKALDECLDCLKL